ncbi:hypothetical protein JD844_015494 [Phrynosoma platyrhinos]|uniref:Uncharacterized protein n=1 Tax=Phrynosoma platyrhinos TaxID=52577 RepID=A0ABQ7SJ52_PHRPL|nr:hypothetical protein JD844_015494 [Phrynosoma platyrhinos]
MIGASSNNMREKEESNRRENMSEDSVCSFYHKRSNEEPPCANCPESLRDVIPFPTLQDVHFLLQLLSQLFDSTLPSCGEKMHSAVKVHLRNMERHDGYGQLLQLWGQERAHGCNQQNKKWTFNGPHLGEKQAMSQNDYYSNMNSGAGDVKEGWSSSGVSLGMGKMIGMGDNGEDLGRLNSS